MTKDTHHATRIHRTVPRRQLLYVVGYAARTVAIGLVAGMGLVAAGLVAGYVVAPAVFAALGA